MRRFATIYNQFLKHVSRSTFKSFVDQYKGDFRTRVFNCWSQFGVMLFAQLTGKGSLREVEIAFANRKNYFYHFGLESVKRSTLADANEKRDWRIYEAAFQDLLLRCHDVSPRHKFRFKNKLESIDATTIDLCLETFPWAEFRQTKGGIKLNVKLDHAGHLPNFVNITNARTHEINVARELKIERGSILVFDRGLIKYRWLFEIDRNKAYFVTRLKKDMTYDIVENPEHKLPPISKRARNKGVLEDKVIRLTGGKEAADIPIELRLVIYQDPESGEIYEYMTNIFHLAASTIAEIYKSRWQIELFFKWIKQHLKIKTFLGTSENAVKTQIWIAMIAYLLLSYIKYKTKCAYSLLRIQRLIAENIFDRIDLHRLLKPNSYDYQQESHAPPGNPNQLRLSL